MPSLERTAYPRFGRVITARELELQYTPTEEEAAWVRATVRTSNHLLCLALGLKCFQRLHYFPPLTSVPEAVVHHLKQFFHLDAATLPTYDRPNTMYRHQQLIRTWLEIEPYYGNAKARRLAAATALQTAEVLDDPVDIANAVIGELQRERIELPAYSTLDRLTDRAHAAADRRLFSRIMRRLSDQQREKLNKLLTVDLEQEFSTFQALKSSARKATLSHLGELLSHLEWLEALGPVDEILAIVPPGKRRTFAHEAKALDAAELKDYREPQRFTLILCLIQRSTPRWRP